MSEFAAKSLRELRFRAGLTQKELAELSGISRIAICHIERGKTKPRQSTWRKLLKAVSAASPADPDAEAIARVRQLPPEENPELFGRVMSREEFLRRLEAKMAASLRGFYSAFLVNGLFQALGFFARDKFYPGDIATGVEIVGTLLRARNKEDGAAPAPIRKRPWRKRR